MTRFLLSISLIAVWWLWHPAALANPICQQGDAAKGGYWWSARQAIMGTDIHVELWHTDNTAACAAIGAVMLEMHRVDDLMSPYKPESMLSALNRTGAHGYVEVGQELFELISTSHGYSVMTGGAFDITYASAGRHYEFRTGKKPSKADLARYTDAINYRHLALDHHNHRVRFDHVQVHVDLGGIAKGHAVDRSIERLQALGVKQARVSAGGDARILGDRFGEPWVVGVRHPRQAGKMAVVLPLAEVAVSTSGDYERYFERDGIRYHHILNPTTGDSARKVQAVTILGPRATNTDALSTSVFVLGVQRGLDLINQLRGIDAIVIDGNGDLHFSAELAQLQEPATKTLIKTGVSSR